MKEKLSANLKKKKLTRKEFLKLATIATVGTVVSTLAPWKVLAKAMKTKRRLAMVIDLRKCIGCHACQVACKSEFNEPLGVWRSWVSVVEKGIYPNVKRYFLPRLCNHCENPPCVQVCPVKATYQREDGIVMQEDDKCIGCQSCIAACPYDVRFLHPTKKVVHRCDFCVHRIDQGYVPACVNTCMAEARIFGDLDDPKGKVFELVNKNPTQVFRPEMDTRPKVFYIGLDKDVASVSLVRRKRWE